MMNPIITTDFVEWQYQLQKNCTWRDYDLYFDIQDILPYFEGFMTFSDHVDENGDKILADSYKFNTYAQLVDYVKLFNESTNYLHCVLKHKVEDQYCLWFAHRFNK